MGRKKKGYKTGDIPLGSMARDTVTGFEGMVVCISMWLNGCDRLVVQPRTLHEGKLLPTEVFDAQQMELIVETNHKPDRSTGGPRCDEVSRP